MIYLTFNSKLCSVSFWFQLSCSLYLRSVFFLPSLTKVTPFGTLWRKDERRRRSSEGLFSVLALWRRWRKTIPTASTEKFTILAWPSIVFPFRGLVWTLPQKFPSFNAQCRVNNWLTEMELRPRHVSTKACPSNWPMVIFSSDFSR